MVDEFMAVLFFPLAERTKRRGGASEWNGGSGYQSHDLETRRGKGRQSTGGEKNCLSYSQRVVCQNLIKQENPLDIRF